ncbi:MAG TPA: YciI-like protein [Terriglobales bacterium]|nr:YciI-like protein [Terriglobales bacterium]
MHYLLFYEVSEDYVSRRAEFRDAHLEKAWKASERGELVLGGALSNPVDGAVLLFKGDSPEVAEEFARADPYVISGAVKRWHVREWKTVAGEDSATPIRPNAPAAKTAGSVSSNPVKDKDRDKDRDKDNANAMILRTWRARATVEKSSEYIEHATKRVFPALGEIKGYRGAYLLQRAVDGAIEFVVLTLWESMEAVRRFAGVKPENAVVEPEARAVLTAFDESVTHFEIVHRTNGAAK